MNAADVAVALGKPRREGRRWRCLCPLHGGHSLTVGDGRDGRIIFKCWGGCDRRDLIAEFRRRHFMNGKSENYRSEANEPISPQYSTVVAFTSIAGDKITGIHRIRVDQPGRWPKADRMMLGRINGSAAKLDPIGNCLVIGEGVETCIAARQIGLRPVWALGSAAGIENFPLVGGLEELIILGENDSGTNRSAALKCQQTWKERRVTIVHPRRAKDMNDFVMEKENVGSAIGLAVQRR